METSRKLAHFKQWVFWTGIFNVVAYGSLVCPFTLKIFMDFSNGVSSAFGLGGAGFSLPSNVNNLIMINTVGFIVIFLGIFLIIASLDIKNRVWFVFWEGWVRAIFFFYSVYFVIFKDAAQLLIVFGLIDLFIAIIYWYYIYTIDELKFK